MQRQPFVIWHLNICECKISSLSWLQNCLFFLSGSCSNFCHFWWQNLAYMLANSMLVHVCMTCECVCIMCFCVCVGDEVLEGSTAATGGSMKEWIGLSYIPLQALPMLRHCFKSPGYKDTVAKKIKLWDSWHIVFFFLVKHVTVTACYNVIITLLKLG